ncbi:glycosyl transferase, partial [Bacteroides fragilis]
MSKVSVLILQHTVSAYNIPMYELLSEMVNLTVGYTRKNESNKVLPFNVKKLKSYLIG